jgi:hypothetical protein
MMQCNIDMEADLNQNRPRTGGTVVTYVVEIEDNAGNRAVKEYDARSPYELVGMIHHELKPYPDFRPVSAWHKEQPEKTLYL